MVVLIVLAVIVAYTITGYVRALGWGSNACVPAHLLEQRHTDRTFLNGWIRRGWTARCLVEPPIMLLGSRRHGMAPALNGKLGPRPIPGNFKWQFSVTQVEPGSVFYLPYFAFTICRLHFRIGTRWDHNDHYFTLDSCSVKIRRPDHLD